MDFVAYFIRFPAVQNLRKDRLRFDKVTGSLKVRTFLRHSVVPSL